MTEPYQKVGRGGAGNFYNSADLEAAARAQEASDLESQPPPPTSQPPAYLHTGRGGLGNVLSTGGNLLQGASPSTSTTSTSTTSPNTPLTPNKTAPSSSSSAGTAVGQGISKPRYRGGRGGAGNYIDDKAEEQARVEEEERQRKRYEEQIARDVERGLARPGKVYGLPEGKGGSWEMGSMG